MLYKLYFLKRELLLLWVRSRRDGGHPMDRLGKLCMSLIWIVMRRLICFTFCLQNLRFVITFTKIGNYKRKELGSKVGITSMVPWGDLWWVDSWCLMDIIDISDKRNNGNKVKYTYATFQRVREYKMFKYPTY